MNEPLENNTKKNAKSTRPKPGEWFRHDYQSRNDKKISQLRMKHGARGYGLYIMLIEMIYENEGGLDLQSDLDVQALEWELREQNLLDFIKDLCEIGLLQDCTDQERIYISPRVLKELGIRQEKSSAAKAAADKRHNKRDATAMRPQCDRITAPLPIQYNTIQDNTNNTKTEIPANAAPAPDEKIQIKPFVHVRLTAQERDKLRAEFPDQNLRYFYFQAFDDWLDAKPKMRSRDANRTIRGWIRRDTAEQRGYFTPKKTGGILPQNREPPKNRADCRPASEVLKAQGIDLGALAKAVPNG